MTSRRILFDFPGHEQNKLFNPAARDGVLEPYIFLRDQLAQRGYELMTADDHPVEGCAWIWFWDVPPIPLSPAARIKSLAKGVLKPGKSRSLYADCQRAGMQDRTVLFIGEPPVVLLRNWEKRYHDLFRIIFTWNDDLVDGKKFFKYHVPLPSNFPEVPTIPFDQKKLLVNISGNKFSTHPQELYSARRATIRYFEQNFPGDFDLYGVGWETPGTDQPAYPSYHGKIDHKWNLYPSYKFGLCYENMGRVSGYVTEKIFDCLRAKCVPIYQGASNVEQFVNQDVFIDRTQFASEADLADYLIHMPEVEHQRYLDAAQVYLKSEKFRLFLSPSFSDTITSVLKL